MPLILVTNDDGYRSQGIVSLADALSAIGDIVVVAPTEEASAIGHALTLKRPLRLEPIRPNMYGVDGTPTDCVNIAITQVLGGKLSSVARRLGRPLAQNGYLTPASASKDNSSTAASAW